MSHRSRFTRRSSMRSAAPWLAGLVAVAACDREPPTAATPADDAAQLGSAVPAPGGLGRPLLFLTVEQRRLFEQGRGVFQTVFTPGTGLGPLFNADGCAACHESPVIGGGGETEEEEGGVPGEDIEVHATAFAGGACDDLSGQGGPVFQKRVTPALETLGIGPEQPPATATAIANRTTPDLFGFGLLDAVSDATILARADPFDRNRNGISGRPNRTADGRVGRFGRKAQVPRLSAFNAEAFVMEMGITNPGLPVEQTPGGAGLPAGVDPLAEPEIGQGALDAANAFVQFLAPPTPQRLDVGGAVGRGIFVRVGCAGCHVPALRTGRHGVRALSNRIVYAYTDLLLHDMGPELADICLAQAEPSEFRTEPLMGLRFVTAFLHDGRAETIEEAIGLHGGEAAAARNGFAALSPLHRAALLRFLRSL
ncbi:MAG: di-heme oxidoredictase family protein [Gemmatimonadales bacterium]